MNCTEDFIVGAASKVAIYFNVSGAALVHTILLEQEIAELKELQARLTSANEDITRRLQRRMGENSGI